MTRRTALVAVTWVASAAGAVLLVVGGQFGGTGLSGSGFPLVLAGVAVDVVVYASVGAILTLRRPGNLVGLVLMAAAILIVLTNFGFMFGAVLTWRCFMVSLESNFRAQLTFTEFNIFKLLKILNR